MMMCMYQNACILARQLKPMSYCLPHVCTMISMDCTRDDS